MGNQTIGSRYLKCPSLGVETWRCFANALRLVGRNTRSIASPTSRSRGRGGSLMSRISASLMELSQVKYVSFVSCFTLADGGTQVPPYFTLSYVSVFRKHFSYHTLADQCSDGVDRVFLRSSRQMNSSCWRKAHSRPTPCLYPKLLQMLCALQLGLDIYISE